MYVGESSLEGGGGFEEKAARKALFERSVLVGLEIHSPLTDPLYSGHGKEENQIEADGQA